MVRGLAAYRSILLPRGAWRFSLAGWLSRLYRVGTVVSVIVLLTGTGESFALSGAAAGAIIVGAAIGGPLWARWADRAGQSVVAWTAAAAALVIATGYTLIVAAGAPAPLLVIGAGVVGLSGANGDALVRSRWMHLLESREDRHRALALESALDELGFLLGLPVLTTIASFLPYAGLVTAAGLGAVGFVGLALLRATAPAPRTLRAEAEEAERRRGWRAWLPVGVAPVIPIFLAVGAIFGFINLMGVAVSEAVGMPGLSGAVIGAFSIGAVVAGLAWGVLSGRIPAARRLVVAGLLFAVLTPLLALATDPLGFGVMAAVVGLGLTPLMISSMATIEERTPMHSITVAMAWPSVALAAGNASASAVVGLAIESVGLGGLWGVPIVIAALVLVGVGAAVASRR